MKHLIALTGALTGAMALASASAYAQIENGDFEAWNSNTPAGWTTIDSGISLSPSEAYVQTGSRSAKVDVTTKSQGSTDFRQSIPVTAGVPVNVAVSVYHTEGHVKARLYVDGYQNFSNPSQTGQWQTLSHTYTPSSNGQIEVGLRFYDTSGFDGNETVYVDNFKPRKDSGPVNPPVKPSCDKTEVNLTLVTDNYGSETSWTLKNSGGTSLYNGSGYHSNTTINKAFCLDDGQYSFTIYDSYGDGLTGNGGYRIAVGSKVLAEGAQFSSSETKTFSIGGGSKPTPPGPVDPNGYYQSVQGLTGQALKTGLFNIIKNHTSRGYSAIWDFYHTGERDNYYENDGSILDIYSEKPQSSDSVTYTVGQDQCGTYRGEGDCYNREHSFPKSWFGGKIEPMNSDVHHIFATDGYVNAKRSNYPYGEVSSASYTSSNGSKLGSSTGSFGTVFEPIDEFKGDLARAYFYMATRYQDRIAGWEDNTSNSDAVLDGTSTQVFEPAMLVLLKKWHSEDPVSQRERDRNQAAYEFQGNRNPFVDHPEFINMIW
ncbi:HNH endonuclease signature motif containing protein [Endozoicomonadaceae bacterium StTr2]